MKSVEVKKKLLDHFLGFISESRQKRFDELIKFRTKYITVVLEDIYQPQNASAVLRTCDCFGIQDIHAIENRNEYEVNPEVALGSSQWVNIIKYNQEKQNTLAAFKALKEQGYKIVATTPHKNDQLLNELSLNSKVALVFGTELNGLSQIAMENADAFVKIPMYGFTESFNISVSAAISLFYLTEKLRTAKHYGHLSEEEAMEITLNWARSSVKKSDLIEKEFLKQII